MSMSRCRHVEPGYTQGRPCAELMNHKQVISPPIAVVPRELVSPLRSGHPFPYPMPSKEPLAADDLHNLVLLYLAVAYEADNNFDPAEHHTILRLLRRWMPGLPPADADAVLNTAFSALRSGMTLDLESLAQAVGAVLSARLRRRVLTDLGQIARADGFLSVQEASTIRRVRAALGALEQQKNAR